MNKLIISGEVIFDTEKINMSEAIDELFDMIVENVPGLDINITNECWLVDENGNDVDEDEYQKGDD